MCTRWWRARAGATPSQCTCEEPRPWRSSSGRPALYLLPLRHPVVGGRQLATLAEISPGRFTFGVGVGGEDPAEYAAAGVPHRERGARADEALALLEKLRTGAEVTHRGRFFDLD